MFGYSNPASFAVAKKPDLLFHGRTNVCRDFEAISDPLVGRNMWK